MTRVVKSSQARPDKERYNQLRRLPPQQLWEEEVPRFNRASPEERLRSVAVIRAVGAAFSTFGDPDQKALVRRWLRDLVHDPSEKIRRYAIAALPKLSAGAAEEAELLAALRTVSLERERKYLQRSLEKIGGCASLEELRTGSGDSQLQTEQKIRANLARGESGSALRLDLALSQFAGLRVQLRCRQGLEPLVRAEIEDSTAKGSKFRVREMRSGLVAITPLVPFTLADIYAFRCFETAGFLLGTAGHPERLSSIDELASLVTSPLALRLFNTFTEGPIRYRLNFVGKGHQRGTVRQLATRAYALCSEILNDPRGALWEIDVHPGVRGSAVELRPKLTPDPRFAYRRQDVPAASHLPLAACLVQLAGKADHEIVWDPFCGSGSELIERTLRGGVRTIYGTDRDPDAIAITQRNFTAANLSAVHTNFACVDFRDWARTNLGPNTVSLIITNPPLGKRVPVPDLDRLIEVLFSAAATVLQPGGRLVLVNPSRIARAPQSLVLQSRQVIDLGGFRCRLELYRKARQGSLVSPTSPDAHLERSSPRSDDPHLK